MKKVGLIFLLATLLLSACREDFEYSSEPDTQLDARKEKLWMIKRVDGNVATKGVAVKDKLWQAGDVIRIKFLNGETALQEKVKEYAAIWLQYANLQFEYVAAEEEADVKIGFDLDERWLSWSVTGTDCKLISQDAPSLNFFELDMTDEEYLKGEVLRGFGHVLGLGFEHRSPESPVIFNSKAENYFKNTCQLSDADVAELLTLYNTDQTNYTEYDESSIMVLDIPKTILTFPKYTISSNTELSDNDRLFIGTIYPMTRDSIVVMVVQGVDISFIFGSNTKIEVDFGDGEKTIVEASPEIMKQVYHKYSNKDVQHIIVIYGSNTTLEKFQCWGSQIKALDISRNSILNYLNCSDTEIKTLNTSKNKALECLVFEYNYSLASLDLSNNSALKSFNCYSNRFSSINVSKNLALETLVCDVNELKKLDISKNIALTYLSCSLNQLEALDVSNNPALTYLTCNSNPITSLNTTGTSIKHLDCCVGKLTELIVNPELEELNCSFNKLSTLDVRNCLNLKKLDCSTNLIQQIDLSQNTRLENLNCRGNQLTTLNLTNSPKLLYLNCVGNELTSLNVNNNPMLISLNCLDNKLTYLNISHNSMLTSLDCAKNQLTTLNVSGNPLIESIMCYGNQIGQRDYEVLVDLANSLPSRVGINPGELSIGGLGGDAFTICMEKNWIVR